MTREMTRKMTTCVFVYGTLKQGRPLDHPQLATLRTDIQEATIVGSIFSLGSYPTIQLDGKGKVRGELHTFSPDDFDTVLSIMDEIEGYDPSSPDDGLYTRDIVEATVIKTDETTAPQTTKAWVYEYNGHVDPDRRLEGGVWEPGM